MNRVCFGFDWGTLVALYMVLLLFGIGFNLLTAWAERKGYLKGYTSLFVVMGVIVTVGVMAVISLAFALITLGAFVFSGLPMIVGDMWRHMREREQELSRLRREARDGDSTETLAE